MLKNLYLIILISLFFFYVDGFSEIINKKKDFTFAKWTKENGLPSNDVTYSFFSKSGFIYLTTTNGLCSFDGSSFKVYNASTNNEFTSNATLRLFENKKGDLYISVSSQGVLIKEKNKDKFISITEKEGLSLNHPSSIVEDDDGNIYVATFGGGVNIINKNYKIKILNKKSGLRIDNIYYLFKDSKKRIWIGATIDKIQILNNGKLVNVKSLVNDSSVIVRKIIEKNGEIFFATSKGIFSFNNGLISEVKYLNYFNDKFISSFNFDDKNRMWISTQSDGLFCVIDKLIYSVDLPFINQKLKINYIDITPIGILLCTNQGLIKLSEKKLEIILPESENDDSNIRSVFQINKNEVLFSSDNELYLLNLLNNKLEKIKSSIGSLSIYSYAKLDNNQILMGSRQNGLIHYNNGSIQKYNYLSGVKRNFIRSIKKIDENVLILGTNGSGVGITKNQDVFYLTKEHGLADNFIGCLFIDDKKNIWIGTSGGGISILNKNYEIIKNITVNDGLSSGIVNSILQDKYGNYWIATNVAGICRIKDNKIEKINKSSGLISNNIKKMIFDGDDFFWITTDNGIVKVSLKQMNDYLEKKSNSLNYEYINKYDGLISDEFNAVSDNAGCLTEKYFLAPSKNGLVIIDQNKQFIKDENITTYIDEINVNNKKIDINNFKELEPNTEMIQIKYGVISYLNSDNITFNYKIQGINSNWISLGNRKEISFNKLPNGYYVLNIYAITSTGIISNILKIPFRIKPYFWQTNEFIFTSIFLIIIISILLIRFYIKINYKRRLEKLESENKLNYERMRISKDMHDEIGAEITGITFMLNKILNQSDIIDFKNKFIPFQNRLKILTQQIDEIVWTVNPKNDTLENTILYAVDFANDMFNNSTIEFNTEIPNEIPEIYLKAEDRHNIILALKEIIVNSIKHSKAHKFFMNIFYEDNTLKFVLIDDGIGINYSQINKFNNGINNIKTRLKKINGSVSFENHIPNGTAITIIYKIK